MFDFDVFEDAPRIERDRYDRPIIDGTPYARISTVAGFANPQYGLGVWKQRHIALAIARRPDLQAMLCGLSYQDGTAVQEIIDEALIRAKDDDDVDPNQKLLADNLGTAFHSFTVPSQRTEHPDSFDKPVAKFYESLEQARLEIVSSEMFVVNDDLKVAGTYDHLVVNKDTGFLHILDKKTGRKNLTAHVAQLEGYANSVHFDPKTGRSEHDAERGTGYIAYTNLDNGECELYEADLTQGLFGHALSLYHANLAASKKKLVSRLT